jgi:tetratricopeptide (TPR) repeat protein
MTTHLVRHQKLTKRQIKEDPLVTAAFRAREFWDAHGQKILIGIGAVVVLAVLGYMILRARGQAEERASGDLFRAEISIQQADYPSAIQVLTQLIESAPDTRASRRAMALLGDSYAAQQKPRDAATWYRKALDKAGKDPILRLSAARGLAASLENAGQFAEAAAAYGEVVRAVKTDNDRGRAMYAQARCLLAAGQRQKAIQILRAVNALPAADLGVTQPALERLGELEATQSG